MADRHRAASQTLIDQISNWGVTVSETRPKRTAFNILLLFVAYSLIAAASIYVLPILVGLLLPYESEGLMSELAVVGAILLLGLLTKYRSGKLPRNALQIDYDASQIRFGSQRPDGVFVRQRVIGFREIDRAYVEGTPPALHLETGGKTVTMHFTGADVSRLEDLASQISAAGESARRAPIRSRIQSRVMSIEANFREVKSRIQSRISVA